MAERFVYFLRFLCRADFMQLMLLSTLLFLLPLNKRQHWQMHMLLVAVPALILNTSLGIAATSEGWSVGISAVYFLAPLAVSLLIFLLCHDGTAQDAVYGMGCAYASQHMGFCVVTILFGEQHLYIAGPLLLLESWLVQTSVLALCAAFFARQLPADGVYAVSWQRSLLHTGIVIFIAMILNRLMREFWQGSIINYNVSLTYDLCSCLFILLLQLGQRRELRLQTMVETERCLRLQAQEQYELSRENIDIINRKCHDLKHQVAALRLMSDPQEREDGLREIERQVMIYNAAAQTGNEVLDTLLTEKGLLCEESQISWTYLADGALLDFMSPVDLYIVMGNALDNAIESSRQIPNVERRVIRVTVREEHGAAFIQVENYFDHPIHTEGGGFQTTKEDAENHGFGLRSIRSITERYGGTLDVETQGGRFLLSILIPIPAQ